MALAFPQNQEIVHNKKNMPSVWKHLVIVIIIYSYLTLPYTDSISLIISGLIFFFFYLYFAYKEIKVSTLWITPISVFLLWNAINLGLSSAYLGYSDLIENRMRKLGMHKIGESGASEEEMNKLQMEVKAAELELASALETVNSSVKRTQNTAELEIANAEKELKKLLEFK